MATAEQRHKEVMGMLSAVEGEVIEIKRGIAERKYLDDKIKEHEAWINGNGKPGAKSQLNTVLLWHKVVIVVLIMDILSAWIS